LYAGVKNLLNWTPNTGNPFIIARANDPFDKMFNMIPPEMQQMTPDNPYALTLTLDMFRTQGVRSFFGCDIL
jgi:outer membrane receptor for ferrienterochelin and colicins